MLHPGRSASCRRYELCARRIASPAPGGPKLVHPAVMPLRHPRGRTERKASFSDGSAHESSSRSARSRAAPTKHAARPTRPTQYRSPEPSHLDKCPPMENPVIGGRLPRASLHPQGMTIAVTPGRGAQARQKTAGGGGRQVYLRTLRTPVQTMLKTRGRTRPFPGFPPGRLRPARARRQPETRALLLAAFFANSSPGLSRTQLLIPQLTRPIIARANPPHTYRRPKKGKKEQISLLSPQKLTTSETGRSEEAGSFSPRRGFGEAEKIRPSQAHLHALPPPATYGDY